MRTREVSRLPQNWEPESHHHSPIMEQKASQSPFAFTLQEFQFHVWNCIRTVRFWSISTNVCSTTVFPEALVRCLPILPKIPGKLSTPAAYFGPPTFASEFLAFKIVVRHLLKPHPYRFFAPETKAMF